MSNKIASDLDKSQKTEYPRYKDTKSVNDSLNILDKDRKELEQKEIDLSEKPTEYWDKLAQEQNSKSKRYGDKVGDKISSSFSDTFKEGNDWAGRKKELISDSYSLIPDFLKSQRQIDEHKAKAKKINAKHDNMQSKHNKSKEPIVTGSQLKQKALLETCEAILALGTGKNSLTKMLKKDLQEYVNEHPGSVKLKSPTELMNSLIKQYDKDGVDLTENQKEVLLKTAREQLVKAKENAAKIAEKKQTALEAEMLRQKIRREKNIDAREMVKYKKKHK